MAQNKLNKELKNLRADPIPQGDAAPKGEDMYSWEGFINGPEGTPYEGGKFKFDIKFPAEYPFKPPKINFSTKVLHPNITDQGQICLDLIADAWNPAVSLRQVSTFFFFLFRLCPFLLFFCKSFCLLLYRFFRFFSFEGSFFLGQHRRRESW
eukprot:Tamp_33322.p1 GENE.Tamp_33322~~Tamp_33322.p1  ORF type:complete len:152 (-),score=25.32 Tamp_33322:66-521(-)